MAVPEHDYPLMDSPEDAAFEERGWVPVTLAESPVEAVAYALMACDWERDRLAADGLRLVCEGAKSWHRPSDEQPYREGEGITLWEECEPSALGAVEFWNLEVVDADAR